MKTEGACLGDGNVRSGRHLDRPSPFSSLAPLLRFQDPFPPDPPLAFARSALVRSAHGQR